MKFCNCRLDEAKKRFAGRKIVFFGRGAWLRIIDHTDLMDLKDAFAYVIDNAPVHDALLGDIWLQVRKPEVLMKEKDVVVILTSPVYMYEMFLQLENMNLGDDIECYAFPFMQKISDKHINNSVRFRGYEERIPRIIHSFWFSGEEKNQNYKRCRSTWDEKLDGYEIIEWTKENYDYHKNRFMEKAIENGAWAFAADFARLDVLYQYGGIYLDMDVEIIKPFDDLLCNNVMLSFSNNTMVDLAVLGSVQGNGLIKRLLDLYEDIEVPSDKKGFSKFFQPAFVRDTLVQSGVIMDGSLQRIGDITVFPHEFFMPLDYVLFDEETITDNTYCIHYDNFGWSDPSDNKREKKIRDNNELWKRILYEESGGI